MFSAAFYALLLANVLYLTGVWHYAVLAAGPRRHAGTADGRGRARRWAGGSSDRFGARAVLVPGALLFAAGCALFADRDGVRDPAYLAHFLPATLLTGTGVGAVYSGLGVATVAALPAEPVRHRQRDRHLRPADRRGVRDLGVAVGAGRGRSVPHGLGAHGGGRRGHRAGGRRGRPGPRRARSPRRGACCGDVTAQRAAQTSATGAVRVAGRGVAAVMSMATSAAPAAATNTTV